MVGRLAVLSVLLATLPLAVDLPGSRDSSRTSNLQVEVATGFSQFAFVSRGCNGEILSVTHNQLDSGALVVEHRLPNNLVIGVRAGNVGTTLNSRTQVYTGAPYYSYRDSMLTTRYSNPYVNPYLGYEGGWAGIGGGFMKADHPLMLSEGSYQDVHTTWHLRFGNDERRLTLRWMEDVPLESEGHFSADLGFHPPGKYEVGVFAGLLGPYDGTMLGFRGRVWFTPEAALQVKASVAENSEYGVYGSVTARLPGVR
jgi:hypothetical protein